MLNKGNKANLIGGKKSIPAFLKQYRDGGLISQGPPPFYTSPASLAIAKEEKRSKYLK